jgi:hypothetical protein
MATAPALARAFLSALRGFLRGFVGATNVGRDAHSVRCALTARAGQRRSCC